MTFALQDTIDLLARTPQTLDTLLRDLPAGWLASDEGPGTWTSGDVVRHLVHGEIEDWLPRTRHVLEHGDARPFPPFDPDRAQYVVGDAGLTVLLDDFARRRADNLGAVRALDLEDADLDRTSVHPTFGRVTLRQHLATWAAHDLDHVRQITRALALRHADDIGPWRQFLTIMD